MNINKQKLLAALAPVIALLAGYFGYEPLQELKSPSVDVDVHIPETNEHTHKNWQPAIDKAVKEAEQRLERKWH